MYMIFHSIKYQDLHGIKWSKAIRLLVSQAIIIFYMRQHENTMHILQEQLMQLTSEQSALTSNVEPIYRGQYLEQRVVSIITINVAVILSLDALYNYYKSRKPGLLCVIKVH